jgi:nucleotide-binding universal stress UspA family protein
VLRAERAVVVNVSNQTVLTPGPEPAGGPLVAPAPGVEAELGRVAQEIAGDGAELARREGLVANAEVRIAAGHAAIAQALGDVAEDYDADLLVIGREGRSRVGEAVLGSVSSCALRDACRPVLVVPAPESG